MKRTFVIAAGGVLPLTAELLHEATQVKNIWVPHGA
jgi:hypothetical protein